LTTRAVFFDFDGTLIDSMPAHVSAWSEILAGIGIQLADKYFELHEGERAEDTISRLLREHGKHFSNEERDALIERKRALYRTRAPKGLIPEARQLVDVLHKREIHCDIVTGSVRKNLDAVLSREEIELFRHIITPEDYASGKPRPDPFLTAIQRSGLLPAHCMVLENAPLGIQSAKAAGLKTIAITTTLPKPVLADADVIINNFKEFIDYL
jgi:HAD superfamily hydrolase (TIGR01509 family)